MEVERLALRHTEGKLSKGVAMVATGNRHAFHAAIHLVGGGVEDEGLGRPETHGLHHIEAAAGVDLKVLAGIEIGGRHGHLGRQVEHHVGMAGTDDRSEGFVVTYVGPMEGDSWPLLLQPLQIAFGAAAGEIVEHGHIPSARREMDGGIGADEAGSAGDQDRRHRSVGSARWKLPDKGSLGGL